MTKAEKIFKDTRYACKKHIEAWGFEENIGFSSLATEELVYKRTANEIKKLIEREQKDIAGFLQFNLITEQEAIFRLQVLMMIANTLKNQKVW